MNSSGLSFISSQGPLHIHWVEKDSDKGKKIRKMQFLDERTKEQHLVVVKNFVKTFSNIPPVSTSKRYIWIQVQDDANQIGWAKVDKKSIKNLLQDIPIEGGLKVAETDGKDVNRKATDRNKTSSGGLSKPLRLFALSLLVSSVSGSTNVSSDLQPWQNKRELCPLYTSLLTQKLIL